MFLAKQDNPVRPIQKCGNRGRFNHAKNDALAVVLIMKYYSKLGINTLKHNTKQ